MKPLRSVLASKALQTGSVSFDIGFVTPSWEDAMNIFSQLQRLLDPDGGGFVLAVVAVSLAAALVLVLAS